MISRARNAETKLRTAHELLRKARNITRHRGTGRVRPVLVSDRPVVDVLDDAGEVMATFELLGELDGVDDRARVLGAQIWGPSAGALIGEVALAISLGASGDELARTPRPSGSLGEVLSEAARCAAGWPLMLAR